MYQLSISQQLHTSACPSLTYDPDDLGVGYPATLCGSAHGLKFPIFAINTFTKWIEVEPIDKITSTTAKKFIMKSIMTKSGVLSRITTENSTQFSNAAYIDYCEIIDTTIRSTLHPWIIQKVASRLSGLTT